MAKSILLPELPQDQRIQEKIGSAAFEPKGLQTALAKNSTSKNNQ